MAGGCPGSQIWDEELQQCVVPPNDGGFDADTPGDESGDESGDEFGQGGCPEGQLYVPADQSESGVPTCIPNPQDEINTGSGQSSEWQFQGMDTSDIEHTPWDDSGEPLGADSSWDVTSDFLGEGGIHTYGAEGIIEWLATQGFGDDSDAVTWFVDEYGGAGDNLGELLAFDQSEIDDLGIGFAMQEDAMMEEYTQWHAGADAILGAATSNFETLAQQQLDAFDLANQERISEQKRSTAELRKTALQGLASSRRASARSGIASGMGSTKGIEDFIGKSREQSVAARAAQQDYLSSVKSTEEELDFNITQATVAFESENAAKQLANQNAMTQMSYDFAQQASSAYEDWYQGLVGMTGAYFQDTQFGDTDFDLFGTGG